MQINVKNKGSPPARKTHFQFLPRPKKLKFDLRVRGDPLILICFFIDFVKIHRYNKGNLILWKSANRSGIDDRSAIFRKINFPLLSRRISTKSMKCSVKNKGSPLARRSKNCKFAATEELSFSCMFYRSNGPRQKKNIDKIQNI